MKKLFLFFIYSNLAFSQINASKLKFPKEPKISQEFQNAISDKIKELNMFSPNQADRVKSYSVEFILDKVDNSTGYGYLYDAEYWIVYHYGEIIPQLIDRITNKKEIGLVNSADLIIPERNENGDLKNYGHGFIVNDDLFTIAGRANRLLTVISGENFGSVSMKSTPQDLQVLQKKWIVWLNEL